MTTNVYIDGFNLYYGALKTRWPQFKWLDLKAFCSALLPTHSINRIRYFTAPVIPPIEDPQRRNRQDAYLRALRTIPTVHVHDEGWFVIHEKLRWQFPLAYPKNRRPGTPPQSVYVQLPEEKGSDVNLASYLLLDCAKGDFEEAVIISNDADLMVPIELVVTQFGKSVGVINPHPKKRRSVMLKKVASWTLQTINRHHVENSQLPSTLTDSNGTITKPSAW
ncbi:MAG: NYN domain-containing protein [Chloroflexi bacterium]|nr:NYN domain-containing protein [Chloroflexota bacterium]